MFIVTIVRTLGHYCTHWKIVSHVVQDERGTNSPSLFEWSFVLCNNFKIVSFSGSSFAAILVQRSRYERNRRQDPRIGASQSRVEQD